MSSPKIVNMRWGSVDVEKIGNDGKPVPGEIVTYRDVKIWPGGSRGWDWNETGTSHWNGITLEDVKELKTSGAKSIVLTRGQMAFLHVPPAVIEDLQKSGFEVIVEKSGTAVDRYNALVERGELVAGLFHTTC